MRIRDALESDAETLATAIDRPQAAVLDMIHDRSVRVAVSDSNGDQTSSTDPKRASKSESETATVEGFVAFDVYDETVHVTDFNGSGPVIDRLFEEPQRFASQEGLAVEVVVPDDEKSGSVVETAGFNPVGSGPQFEGRATTRYRIESNDIE